MKNVVGYSEYTKHTEFTTSEISAPANQFVIAPRIKSSRGSIVELEWEIPKDTGGGEIVGYRVYRWKGTNTDRQISAYLVPGNAMEEFRESDQVKGNTPFLCPAKIERIHVDGVEKNSQCDEALECTQKECDDIKKKAFFGQDALSVGGQNEANILNAGDISHRSVLTWSGTTANPIVQMQPGLTSVNCCLPEHRKMRRRLLAVSVDYVGLNLRIHAL